MGLGAATSAASAVGRGAVHSAGAAVGAYREGGAIGVAKAGAAAVASPLRRAAENVRGAFMAGSSGMPASSANPTAPGSAPAWARAMRRRQQMAQGARLVTGAIRSGDGGGAGSSVNLSEGV